MAILAAAGGEHNPDRIIAQAYELATAYNDELEVVHVIPEDEADAHFEELRSISEFQDFGFDIERDRASDVARRMLDLPWKTMTPIGSPRSGGSAIQVTRSYPGRTGLTRDIS